MEQATCRNCTHYRQHYSFLHNKLIRVYCGHCTCTRVMTKRPDTKACTKYVQAEPDKSFVTKEYLSKALLEYMVKLELLPQIQDAAFAPEKERGL